MNALLKKLNFKTQNSITVINSPVEFHEHFIDFENFAKVKQSIDEEDIEFALVFCQKLEEVHNWAPKIAQKIKGDDLFWFAYPKKSSKKYSCDFNRDNGWDMLGKLGYEPVRMVAIDDDWSALRFRKAEYIKILTRDPSWIKSEEGKKKSNRK